MAIRSVVWIDFARLLFLFHLIPKMVPNQHRDSYKCNVGQCHLMPLSAILCHQNANQCHQCQPTLFVTVAQFKGTVGFHLESQVVFATQHRISHWEDGRTIEINSMGIQPHPTFYWCYTRIGAGWMWYWMPAWMLNNLFTTTHWFGATGAIVRCF